MCLTGVTSVVFVDASLWRPPALHALATHSSSTGASTASPRTDNDLREQIPCYAEIGEVLLELLRRHAKVGKAAVFASFEDGKGVVDAFLVQFEAYARQQPPFRRDKSRGWRAYWLPLASHPDANVLAVRRTHEDLG